TSGGARTRSFRVEGPASSPVRPRRQEGSGGRGRTCASRLTVARLTARPHRNEAEGEGVEPPRPRGPPVVETGYHAYGSPSVMAPAGIEPATAPIKSRRLCRLSYEARV